MLHNIEETACEGELHLCSSSSEWEYCEDSPHILPFHYQLILLDPETDETTEMGHADGYRIRHNWTAKTELSVWDEGDALDADIVRYIEALIKEFRACDEVFDTGFSIIDVPHITILRHVEANEGVDSATLIKNTAASIAMMDAPTFMLVDPALMPKERKQPAGRLQGRAHIPGLIELGFVRMVSAPYVWGWDQRMVETIMQTYSYDTLSDAKQAGILDDILNRRIAQEMYQGLPDEVADQMDFPGPNDHNSY